MKTYTYKFASEDSGFEVALDVVASSPTEARNRLRSIFDPKGRIEVRPHDLYGNSAHVSVLLDGAKIAKLEPHAVREHRNE